MTFLETKAADQAHTLPTYARYEVCLTAGTGATATDIAGKTYIDFGSGIGVNSLGYCEPGYVAAVTAQLQTLQHTSNLYYSLPQTELAGLLTAATGMDKVFFANSGAEANECAIKVARKYSAGQYGAARSTIITLVNSFHGRTVTTLSATGQEDLHQHFLPLTEGFVHVKSGDLPALSAAVDDTVCAVMLEPIQGEGGVVPLDAEYVQAVAELCAERDLLLIFDEVQTGIGRTGSLLAHTQFGVTADIVTLAKGLGGGLPIGACLIAERAAAVMTAGTHGSTFGGNPAVCAGACYVLSVVDQPGFLAAVTDKGAHIRERLSKMPGVRSVRGMGLMLGIVLDDDLPAARTIAERCLEQGLIILTAKSLLRLLPPLNITEEELNKGLDILETVLKGAKQA